MDFFTNFIDWAQSRSIRIVFPSLPVAAKAYDLMRKAGALEVPVPYFVDKKVRNDPSNVLYHTISECRKAKTSRIYVDGSHIITSLTADAIATALLNEAPLATYTESVQISKMAAYLAETTNCSVEFANHASVPVVDGELPSFVTYAANARDKTRQLYLSIVVVGRHDGFAKGFEKRAQIFLDALANHTQKVPLASYEIVFVDYSVRHTDRSCKTLRGFYDTSSPTRQNQICECSSNFSCPCLSQIEHFDLISRVCGQEHWN